MSIKGLCFVVGMYVKRLVREILKSIWNFLSKKRFIKSYKKKKAILLIFLVMVDIFILNDVIEKSKGLVAQRVAESVSVNVAETKTEDSQGGVGGDILPPSSEELSVEDKICNIFPENCDVMKAIAMAESSMNPNAINWTNSNGTIDVGLMMINSCHGYDKDYLLDVDNNLKVARKIYDKSGLTAWSAYNNNKYLKYM